MKLAELMEEQGFSYQDLSEAAGVAKATLVRIVHGQSKKPHPKTKKKIAAVFGVKIKEIDEFSTNNSSDE